MSVVVVGGGHGASASLRAARLYSDDVTGIITVADNGGSSGRLARELGVLPMGDIRNCLAALAPDSPTVSVFQHRFPSGRFEGHVVGNLMIAAAAQESGSFVAAIEQAAALLGAEGRILPPTLDPVRLISEVEGQLVEGQVEVATSTGRITFVALDPADPKPFEPAVQALTDADQIVLGPGSLFTSVLPPLLVRELKEALVTAHAQKVYVCNLVAPLGETQHFDAAAHLSAVYAHLGTGSVDVVVAHTGRPPTNGPAVAVDIVALKGMGVLVVGADLLPTDGSSRHDPARLADVLKKL
ncbi:MAG: uridine diphosphate-N-acetylglucosamine-binding protein YvcK [Actinomycetota bacterium]|nr:uridine diphosphate-N-acetylglucosamine-binding protein YvcK [Actinomycetota bacterium]